MKARIDWLVLTCLGLAVVSVVSAVLTVVWRDWIELVFRVDPDQHSGSLERTIAVGSLLIAVAATSLAGHRSRQLARKMT